MGKKYELTDETCVTTGGHTLHRIRALRDVGATIKAGDIGGWIESERNLSHEGTAWVYDDARVYDSAWVYGKARVSGGAWVYGDAHIAGGSRICGSSVVE